MPSRFRTSFTSREGFTSAQFVQCKIVDINLVNWTVDVVSQFDRKRYFGIQVSSPYLHFNNGEGIFCFPEIGAVCFVCIPSDSSPMFVAAFIMPHENVDSNATFAGGRPTPKPGDIWMRTRDGNFITLHRGGVLQLGANELSQRIFIPLNNLMMDISGSYAHHNAAGSVNWGFQEGPSEEKHPCLYTHTFRIKANDAEADVRIQVGEVRSPLGESATGDQTDLDQLEIGNDKAQPIIYEVSVCNKGFNTASGDIANTSTVKNAVLRFFFDRKGATFLRCEGSILLSTKKKLKIKVSDSMEIEAKSLSLTVTDGADIGGGTYTHVKGDLVRLGPGVTPVARQGDIVTMVIQPGLTIQGVDSVNGPIKAIVMPGMSITGTITSGNSKVLA